MNITRRSAIKTIGAAIGSTTLTGFTTAPVNSSSQSSNSDFNVRDFGAKGNGNNNDTGAINKAITAAAKESGGKVVFPSGRYLSGSIYLKSNLTLSLGSGAVLEAIDDPDAYDPPEPFEGEQYQDFGHSHWQNSLMWGKNLQNVTIEGPGTIYGKGLLFEIDRKTQKGEFANKCIGLKECQNVVLKDFTIKHGGHFGILATGVDNFTINNLLIDTNRDGMDIDSCRNVRISNCTVNAPADDSIVLKSSFALGYARPVQDVTITNCTVSGFDEGTVLDGTAQMDKDVINDAKQFDRRNGRIKFGTESNGGFKNVTISNCTFDHCRGLALELVDGGALEDVSISNITMRTIELSPIFMRLGRRQRGPKGIQVGKIRRINISNVVVHNAQMETGVIISGIPGHRIEDVKISNIHIQYEGGGIKKDAANKTGEMPKEYPDPDRFGTLPSSGMYLHHMQGIEITNAKITYDKKDERPVFVLDDVVDADFRFVKARRNSDASLFSLNNTERVRIFECNSLPNQTLKNVNQQKI